MDHASHSSSKIISDVIDLGKISTLQILIITIALVLNMLDGFDVTSMSFTAHAIGEQLNLPADKLGIVFSAALAGMMAGAMFLAPYSDVIGRRKLVLLAITAIGSSMLLTVFATQLWQLVIIRTITGLGVGAMLASLAALCAEYTPIRYRSLSVVSITAGYPLGATLGGFIAAPLIPAYGWQSVYLLAGGATLLMLIPVFFLVPESLQFLFNKRPVGALERVNTTLARLGKDPLEALPVADVTSEASKANVFSLLTEDRRRLTLTLWTSFFFCFICLYFLMSWIPKLVINAGLPEAQGIYAAVAFNGGGVLGIVSLGWLSARIGLSTLIGSFLASSAACMVIFAMTSDSLPLLLSLLLIGFLLQGGFTGLYAVAAKVYPTEVRATGVGWAIGLGRFGAVVGPYVGGLLIVAGFSMESNFIIFAIPLILGGIMAFRLKVK
jgi:benzoate transport